MTTRIALKIDVCNHRSLHEGVPALAKILAETGVRASFFVTFGPDNSGRAVRRIFRRGFLSKMLRTRAPRMYGVRTLLYGTLLPAPMVGESAPELLQSLERAGHEVGLHGYDHVGWHDGLARMSEHEVREVHDRAVSEFTRTLGHAPRFSGAPGWQVSADSLRLQDELAFEWASDCRDGEPFYPEVDGVRVATLQIPTCLPTSDELLGAGSVDVAGLAGWYREHLVPGRCNVVGIHAEAEGICFSGWFRDWLANPGVRDFEFVTISEIVAGERASALVRPISVREIPGRAGTVACPATSLASDGSS